MILLGPEDVLAVAADVLGCGAAVVVERADLVALDEAIGEQQTSAATGGSLGAAGGLLAGLVQHRPFRGPNRTIALAATLQLLALNGLDLDLEPPGEIDVLLDKVAEGNLPPGGLAAALQSRLRPLHDADPVFVSTFDSPQEDDMFERFTDRARQVMVLAQEEARMLDHSHIGTEHLLLGLLHEGEGVAARALANLGVSLEAVRAQVDAMIGRGQRAPGGHIPFRPRAKKALELALRESLRLGDNYIGTEHILLGLIREGDGVAAQVLVELGASPERVRQQVLEARSAFERDIAGPLGLVDDVREPLHRGTFAGRRVQLLNELNALFDENDRLRHEIDRLRRALRDRGIDPDAA